MTESAGGGTVGAPGPSPLARGAKRYAPGIGTIPVLMGSRMWVPLGPPWVLPARYVILVDRLSYESGRIPGRAYAFLASPGFLSAHLAMGRPATAETALASAVAIPHLTASSSGPPKGSHRPSSRATQKVTMTPTITTTQRIHPDKTFVTPLESFRS